MTSRTDDGLVWAVKPKDLVLVKESGAVMPLKKAMADAYSSYAQIFGYDAFVAGALPKDLKALTGRPFRVDFSHASFNSDRGAIKKTIEIARKAEKCQCVWVVRGDNDKKWVRPCGLAIVNNAQIVLEPEKAFRL